MKIYCRVCNSKHKKLVEMRPGKAMVQNNLIPCYKCPECGHSVMGDEMEKKLFPIGSVYYF